MILPFIHVKLLVCYIAQLYILFIIFFTGIRFIDENRFVSTSIDQKVILWDLSMNNDSDLGKFTPIISHISPIADISSIELIAIKKWYVLNIGILQKILFNVLFFSLLVLVCGEGFELLRLSV